MTMTEREGAPHRRPCKKRRHPLRWLIALLALAAGGWFWFQWQCWGLQTTHTQVALSGLPQGFDGYKIVHLSDLHGHEYGEGSRELLDRVRGERPDLIVITGDLIDQKSQMTMISPLAQGLAAIAPTYYVTGNHEWALGTGAVKELKALLIQCGVTPLSNQYEVLERGGDRLVLDGVDEKVIASARNIPGVKTAQVNTLNVYDILGANKFIVAQGAVEKIEEVYA